MLDFIRRKFRYWQRLRSLNRRRTSRFYIPGVSRWVVVNFKLLSLILVLALFLCSIYLLLRSDIFLLRNYEMIPLRAVDPAVVSSDEVEKAMEKYFAVALFRIKTSQVEAELREQFPALEDVEIKRRFPDTLEVYWKERVPVAVVYQGQNNFLVDQQGFVYGRLSPNAEVNLPRVKLDQKETLALGERLRGGSFEQILDLLQSLEEQQVAVKEVTLYSDELTLDLAQGGKVLLRLSASSEMEVRELAAILERYRRQGDSFREIDLRFKTPVVR